MVAFFLLGRVCKFIHCASALERFFSRCTSRSSTFCSLRFAVLHCVEIKETAKPRNAEFKM